MYNVYVKKNLHKIVIVPLTGRGGVECPAKSASILIRAPVVVPIFLNSETKSNNWAMSIGQSFYVKTIRTMIGGVTHFFQGGGRVGYSLYMGKPFNLLEIVNAELD